MKKLLTVLFVVAMALGALVGCGSNEPKGEQVFVYGASGEIKYLDPSFADDAISNNVLKQVYEGLFSFKPDGSLQNELCASYTISDDGLVYTFKLIDANWSDGQPITAQHFVDGIKHAIGYGPDSYYSAFIYKYVTGGDKVLATMTKTGAGVKVADLPEIGVKALDDKTLEITLVKKTPFFLQLMMQNVFLPIRAEFAQDNSSAWAADPKVPTNGAFKLESFNEKEEVVLVKNPNYRNASKVSLDKIIFKVMPDQEAQLSAFQAGELTFASGVPSSVIKAYDGKPEFFVIDPYVINYFVTLQASGATNKALADVRVRKALSMAINRDDLLKVLDSGSTKYALYGFVPKGIAGIEGDFREEQDKVLRLSDTNVEEAKKLLAEAGYGNGLKLTYYYNKNQLHDDVAQAIQAQWKAIGVDVELKTGEIRTFFSERTKGKYEMARHANSADYLDPYVYLEMYESANDPANIVHDAKYDAMLTAANAEGDVKKRMQMLHEAENYFVNEMAYVIPLFGYASPELCKAGVKGIASSPDGAKVLRYVTLP